MTASTPKPATTSHQAEPLEPRLTIDGNEAAARVAYRLSEVIAIYPITPASLCSCTTDGTVPQRLGWPAALQLSHASAIGVAGVIG